MSANKERERGRRAAEEVWNDVPLGRAWAPTSRSLIEVVSRRLGPNIFEPEEVKAGVAERWSELQQIHHGRLEQSYVKLLGALERARRPLPTMSVHSSSMTFEICEKRGWIEKSHGQFYDVYSLTQAGHAALAAHRGWRHAVKGKTGL